MKLLFVNQFFWPDVAPTGQLLSDLTEHLTQEGHEVTVICSRGAYADGGSAKLTAADGPAPSIRILRVPGFTYQRGSFGRLFSYAIFLLGSLWYELRLPRQDLVVT